MCRAEPTRREMLRRFAVGAAGVSAVTACGTAGPTVSSARQNGNIVPEPTDGTATTPTIATPVASTPAADAALVESRFVEVAPGQVEVMPGLVINRRELWGADLPATGAIAHDEVKFLLVHHTASTNSYTDPVPTIRSAFSFHTGPDKVWPDVAYHFFVARDGTVWEGRTGSLRDSYEASATGGNQGWAQLVCLIGNHVSAPPTAEAQASLVKLLKWLGWRYRLNTTPAATATYVSRGSNKHPGGATVTTPVISGHRDASATACPGDAAYDLLPGWRAQVAAMPDPVFPEDGPLSRARRLGRISVDQSEN